jgi:ketosteroid isomerase-like protein
MTENNVELVRRGWEAAVRGDLDAIRDLLDPNVKWHGGDPSSSYACHNREEALAFMVRVDRRTPRELVDVVGAGDKVVIVTRRAGSEAEPEQLGANLTIFRAGRVVEMVHYPNPQDALAAAGL